jgi:hypothetical protein
MYLLYAFSDGHTIIVTRGIDESSALRHAVQSFARGSTVYPIATPINAKEAYDRNHPFDWLNTPPRYMLEG